MSNSSKISATDQIHAVIRICNSNSTLLTAPSIVSTLNNKLPYNTFRLRVSMFVLLYIHNRCMAFSGGV